ncbi:MAG: DinB family protein [Phaeodactylibacter sp.]|nr:DinB family protein [Phaeodactylibacter sp.]
MKTIPKPKPGEYPAYAEMYLKWIPDDGNLLGHLQSNFETVKSFILSLPESRLLHRYAEGKWTIKEVLLHIIDDERIYAYRALRFARNDKTPLPGFEQDDYTPFSGANDRDISSIMDEYESVRKATITLFAGLPEESLQRGGVADGKPVTVRALGYHLAGHEMHHLNIIREKYLTG